MGRAARTKEETCSARFPKSIFVSLGAAAAAAARALERAPRIIPPRAVFYSVIVVGR